MMQDCLARKISDIRRGNITSARGPMKAGWAMGPFYATHELAFTRDFEIKEWDDTLVRKTWDDHAHNGPEYISVTHGKLTMIIGERSSDVELPIETKRVVISAGSSVVVRPGLWRRFECTPTATGVSVRHPGKNMTGGTDKWEGCAPYLNDQYREFTEHWKHTDQIRQLLLYNFLMASTILMAAWGVLYSQSAAPLLLLKTLSGLGLISSLLWYGLAFRATGYYDMYESKARLIEESFPESHQWPFHLRATFRNNFPRFFGLRIRAAMLLSGVPLLFFMLFVLTAIL
jgi:hypothetical protein